MGAVVGRFCQADADAGSGRTSTAPPAPQQPAQRESQRRYELQEARKEPLAFDPGPPVVSYPLIGTQAGAAVYRDDCLRHMPAQIAKHAAEQRVFVLSSIAAASTRSQQGNLAIARPVQVFEHLPNSARSRAPSLAAQKAASRSQTERKPRRAPLAGLPQRYAMRFR